MYPRSNGLAKQRGVLLPLAIILITGIGILALTISRLSSQSNVSSVYEGLSLQAFYAAESGTQYGLNVVLFDVTDRAVSDASCAGLSANPVYLNFNANGLQSCGTFVSCACEGSCAGAGDISYYTINSRAQCGDFDADGNGNITRRGALVAEREINVTAFQ